jgi:putative transposase
MHRLNSVSDRARSAQHLIHATRPLAMVFKLMMSAKKKWRKLCGTNRLPEVIQGVEFKDGIKQLQKAA